MDFDTQEVLAYPGMKPGEVSSGVSIDIQSRTSFTLERSFALQELHLHRARWSFVHTKLMTADNPHARTWLPPSVVYQQTLPQSQLEILLFGSEDRPSIYDTTNNLANGLLPQVLYFSISSASPFPTDRYSTVISPCLVLNRESGGR